MANHRFLTVFLLLAGLGSSAMVIHAAAQAPRAFPEVSAVRRDGPIRIDGSLDDPEWRRAIPVSGFVASEPVEGVPAQFDTEVYLLYDEDAIYVGARMLDDDPESTFRQLTRRDYTGRVADYFEISIDSNLDRRTAYTFRVSAAGVQEDRYTYDDTSADSGWDAVWESGAMLTEDGWTAEARIPLSQLRYTPSGRPQTWGINFARRRNAGGEKSFWALESRVQHGGVSVYGFLHGLELPNATRALELRPYTLVRRQTAEAEPGNPFFDGTAHAIAVGTDLRYGLGSTFMLDLTVNPDFGQVEVDPAVINLTAYETFYPEQRPFFSRDDRLFNFGLSGGNNQLFYSRRVGRAPQGPRPAGADHVDTPAETRILTAAKVTGRTSAGLTLGGLAALTDAASGRAYFAEADSMTPYAAEPTSLYGVVTAQQDFRAGASFVRGLLSGMRRDLPEGGALDGLVNSAINGGINFEHSWNDREWALFGFLAGSRVSGTEASIIRYQRSPNHYFQRPDAHNLEVDSTATSMVGAEWRLQFERRSGEHWTGAIWAAQRTPGFEVDDIGYGRASERLDGGARVTYREITPGRVFRDYQFRFNTFHNWRHEALDHPFSWSSWWDRAHKSGRFSLTSGATLLNYWGGEISIGYSPEYYSDSATRGGPLMVSPADGSISVNINSDQRRPFSIGPRAELEVADGGGRSLSLRSAFRWRPTSAIEIDVEPEYEFSRDPAQYVATSPDPLYTTTYGARHLFSEIEQRTVTMPVRLNLVFSPTLTLQFFAQPLLSSGAYLSYKQLTEAETFDFEHFEEGLAVATPTGPGCVGGRTCVSGTRRYIDFDGDGVADHAFTDRDFNVRSLRGNSVLRWEYRPGSTIFLVWQQNRSEERNFADFDPGRDARALLGLRPENTFILKVNRWLGF